MLVELHVYDIDNMTHLAILENARNIKFLAELNNVGAGSFEFPAGDAKSAHIAAGNVVRVLVQRNDGSERIEAGAFIIEQVDEQMVGDGIEGLGEGMLRASGRGVLALWDVGIVWADDITDYSTVETTYFASTFASILLDQRSKAMARGVTLPGVSFTSSIDSDGVAFVDSNTLTVRAGQPLLDLIRTHADYGIEVTTDADGTLNYYVSHGATRSIWFRQGLNILSAKRSTSIQNLRNAILAEGQYVLVEKTDAASISSYGRRERIVKLGNAYDSAVLDTLAQHALDGLTDETVSIMLTVADIETPFLDYELGDTVHVVIPGRIDEAYRVRAIVLEQVEGGWKIGLGLNDLMDEYFQRVDKALRRSLLSPLESIESGSTDPNAGGWKISRSELIGSATVLGSAGYLRLGTGTDIVELNAADATYRIWAGDTDPVAAPFSVTKTGKLNASGAEISGVMHITNPEDIDMLWDINDGRGQFALDGSFERTQSLVSALNDYGGYWYSGQTDVASIDATGGPDGGPALMMQSRASGSGNTAVYVSRPGISYYRRRWRYRDAITWRFRAKFSTDFSGAFYVGIAEEDASGGVLAWNNQPLTPASLGSWEDVVVTIVATQADVKKIRAYFTFSEGGSGTVWIKDATLEINKSIDMNGLLTMATAPDGQGLYSGSDHLGYYDGNTWKTYMASNGDFFLSGSGDHYLQWDASAGKLSVKGTIDATYLTSYSGIIGGFTITSTTLESGSLKIDAANETIWFGGGYLKYYSGANGVTIGDWLRVEGTIEVPGANDYITVHYGHIHAGDYIWTENVMYAEWYFAIGPPGASQNGVDGTFTSNDTPAKTITVVGGIITNIS